MCVPCPHPPKACTVAIIVEDDIVRIGIEAILKRSRKFSVCGLATAEHEGRQIIEAQRPNVLVLDLFLASRDGISLLKDMVNRYPAMAILAISEQPDIVYAERAIRAGARGFLGQDASSQDLIAAVDQLWQGQRYLTRRFAFLISGATATGAPESEVSPLTDRELHVFRLIGLGLGTGEIARTLGLSRKTVESYNENIKRKLGLAGAVALKERATFWMNSLENQPSEKLTEVKTGDDP